MTIILAGAGVSQPHGELFRKLRKHGLLLTGLDAATMPRQIEEIFISHAATARKPYANWYTDSGNPLKLALPPSATTTSYPQLEPLRLSTLSYVADLGAEKISSDPVLQRFYTELFTEGSGPQVFSTSFVQ